MLDLWLPCRDNGRRESRLIQEAFDFEEEKDALGVSGIVLNEDSPCLMEGALDRGLPGEVT
jgi:hypothetical protein